MKDNILQRLDKLGLPDEAMIQFMKLYDASKKVSFGKISPRQDGYLCGDLKLPRCTSILQMDGSKAGALMEWAKREVANKISQTLVYKLHKGDPITEWVIDDACKEGLADPDKQKNDALRMQPRQPQRASTSICQAKPDCSGRRTSLHGTHPLEFGICSHGITKAH